MAVSIPSEDLMDWLALDASIGLTKAMNLFRSSYPDGIEGSYVSIHDGVSSGLEVAHDNAARDEPSLQVIVHNEDPRQGDETMHLANRIYGLLLDLVNFTAPGGTWYQWMRPIGPPRPFARSKPNDGWRVTFNVTASRGIAA